MGLLGDLVDESHLEGVLWSEFGVFDGLVEIAQGKVAEGYEEVILGILGVLLEELLVDSLGFLVLSQVELEVALPEQLLLLGKLPLKGEHCQGSDPVLLVQKLLKDGNLLLLSVLD